MEHLRRSAGQPDVPSKHMISETLKQPAKAKAVAFIIASRVPNAEGVLPQSPGSRSAPWGQAPCTPSPNAEGVLQRVLASPIRTQASTLSSVTSDAGLVKPFQSTRPIKRALTASTHCQAVKRTAFLTKPPTQTRLGRPSETRQPIKAQNPSPHQNSVDGLLSQVHSLECEWRQLLEMENANKHLSTRIN